MITPYRMQALLQRFILMAKRDYHRIIDLVYWPLQDLLLWGFTGFWMQTTHDMTNTLLLLNGLVIWTFMVTIVKEIPWTLLDELWSYNFTNLFASPLELADWMSAVMTMGTVKALMVYLYCSALVYLIYGLSIYSVGWVIVPTLLIMLIFGATLGFFTAGCIMYFGQRVQMLTWILGWLFTPFSGAFYPIEVLPVWAQKLSYLLPPAYAFKAIRAYVQHGQLATSYFMIGGALALLYLLLALWYFTHMFERSKEYGLTRLEQYK